MKKLSLQKIVVVAVLSTAVYFSVFHHLGTAPIRIWDESLFAMRAYYMAETGGYLPDFEWFPGIGPYRNLKPPFGTFIQALSFELLGYSELSLRLPIALFVVGILLYLVFFLKNLTKSYRPGIFAVLILISSLGFIVPHVARTGDQDAIYVFFMVAQLGSFFLFTEKIRGQAKNVALPLFTAATLLAFFTKGIMAFFLFPGYMLFILLRKQFVEVFRRKIVFLHIGLGVLTIFSYYTLMEYLFPGFVKMIFETVWGRYVTIRDDHQLPWYFYLQQFSGKGFWPWVLLLPLSFVLMFQKREEKIQRFCTLLWTALVTFLLIITLSKTKLYWYDALSYPIAAMLTAVGIHSLLTLSKPRLLFNLIVWLLFGTCFLSAYYKVIVKNDFPKWQSIDDRFAYIMKHLAHERPEIKRYTIYCGPYNGQVGFYAKLYNDHYGYDIRAMTYWDEVPVGKEDLVLICHDEKKKRAEQAYKLYQVASYDECQLVRLE